MGGVQGLSDLRNPERYIICMYTSSVPTVRTITREPSTIILQTFNGAHRSVDVRTHITPLKRVYCVRTSYLGNGWKLTKNVTSHSSRRRRRRRDRILRHADETH